MEEKRIRRNLYRVLRKTGVDKSNITLKTSYRDDLRFDQVDWSIFVYYLEGIFNISIRDEELNELRTVQNTIRYLGQTA
jgi:acyl carrier protein